MKTVFFVVVILTIFTALRAAGGEPVLVPDLSRLIQPGENRYFSGEGRNTVLNFTATRIGDNTVAIPVDPALLAGRTVTLSGEVFQKDVSSGPHPWNGVRLALRLVDEKGETKIPQINTVPGSQKWRTCQVSVRVPKNLKSDGIDRKSVV